MANDQKFSFAKEDVWQINLKEDFTAQANFCKDGDLVNNCDN